VHLSADGDDHSVRGLVLVNVDDAFLRDLCEKEGQAKERVSTLHVEYSKRGNEYGILYICSLFCEYTYLEYVRIHVIYRVYQRGIRYSCSCGCATGIREYLFNT